MDPVYRVSFFKYLLNSTGRPFEVLQASIEVHAPDNDQAIDRARSKFAELEGVASWSLRADYARIELLADRKHVTAPRWSRHHHPRWPLRNSHSHGTGVTRPTRRE
ncbi:MAG: hypothetical protein FWD12_11465 [Alphaproteobacteria bacterium]|nr:hypothetical protein [Alphaproteobacteria bacterium]